jgi:hypothetical protein
MACLRLFTLRPLPLLSVPACASRVRHPWKRYGCNVGPSINPFEKFGKRMRVFFPAGCRTLETTAQER